jgi:hypothetical protein
LEAALLLKYCRFWRKKNPVAIAMVQYLKLRTIAINYST